MSSKPDNRLSIVADMIDTGAILQARDQLANMHRTPIACVMLAEVATPAALICLDPGHNTAPAVGSQTEPIGPGSSVRKIKDGGGASGEAPVAYAIALRMTDPLSTCGLSHE